MKFTNFLYDIQNKLIEKDLPISSVNLICEYLFEKPFQELLLDDYEVSKNVLINYEILEKKLFEDRVPIAQIVGFEYFYGRKIIISNDVLIPRIETEELVYNMIEIIRKKYPKKSKVVIADICTGSGIIGMTTYLELKNDYDIKLYATDISKQALLIAKKNFDKYEVPAILFDGDLLDPLIKEDIKVDILISNPPYIKTKEELSLLVTKNEPSIALYGGDTGCEPHIKIINKINQVLNENFIFGFELGEGHTELLSNVVNEIFSSINEDRYKDLFDRERNYIVESK